jgi:hypothetical protein
MMQRIELPDDGISDVDLRALQDAVVLSRASGQACGEQFSSMFDEREWFAVATRAAFDCQMRSLGLRPWQSAPMHVDLDARKPGDEEAKELLCRMLAIGVSRFHPNPREALAAAEGRPGSRPVAQIEKPATLAAPSGKRRGWPPGGVTGPGHGR